MRVVRGIYRYPIKGLSAQPVLGITLEAGKPFPFDRVFALARPGVPIDPTAPQWAKKGFFVMLMLHETLASVQTHLDSDTMQLKVLSKGSSPDEAAGDALLTVDLMTAAGREALENFIEALVPGLKARPRLLHAPQGHFMDKPDSVMSCINLATIRQLENAWGHPINPLRFRANFYIDGAAPWEEFDWIGSDITLGDVLFSVDRRNGRCGATNVNPVSGVRDLDIPGALRKSLGHKDLGIYLVARKTGKVVVGDEVMAPISKVSARREAAGPSFAAPSAHSFICRGCYFIYDESGTMPGGASGIPFAARGADWRCPDCGTEKSSFRPYEPEPADFGRA
jgi:GntR family transcriptional regulator / MocR family aminotransferase